MKLTSCILILVFFISACSTDFKTATPQQDIIMVNAILDMADTAHYISIRKAFTDNYKSAYDMAQDPYENFFSKLDVHIIASKDSIILNNFQLQCVDLNLEGYPKKPGTFFTSPNYVYKFTNKIDTAIDYRLVIKNQLTGRIDSSETILLVNGSGSTKHERRSIQLQPHKQKGKVYRMGLYYPAGSVICEAQTVFHYVDSNILTGETADSTVSLIFGPYDFPKLSNFFIDTVFQIDTVDLLNFFAGNIKPASANIVRLLDTSEAFAFAGAKELATYVHVNNANLNGLTGEMISPLYTNMKGNKAFGIFSSGSTSGSDKAVVSDEILRLIQYSTLTKQLRFVGRAHK